MKGRTAMERTREQKLNDAVTGFLAERAARIGEDDMDTYLDTDLNALDVRFGDEGHGNWTRVRVTVTADHISAARRLLTESAS